MQSQSTQRLFQLSYLRAFVALLVVIHHSVLAYISIKPPRLPFTDPTLLWAAFPISDSVKWPGFDLLAGWNDIFFMALMFLLSGLFVWPGLKHHHAGTYLRRRLLRLGLPFVVGAGVLAPLAYYPAYLRSGGEPHLGSYLSAWHTLASWPAGPVWFLWVLFVFDCTATLSFLAIPRAVEAMAGRVRAVSKRPMLLFLLLATMSLLAYAPMSMRFGALTWWGWGPFAVQTSRVLHYFVYFALGVCLGASGIETEILGRTGGLARGWWLWCIRAVHGHDRVCTIRVRDGGEDRVRVLVRGIKSVRDGAGHPVCAAVALGGQPQRKRVRDLPGALRVCYLDSVRGAGLAGDGIREGRGSITCSGGYELDDGRAHEAE